MIPRSKTRVEGGRPRIAHGGDIPLIPSHFEWVAISNFGSHGTDACCEARPEVRKNSPRRARRTRRMLQARDAFSSSILIMRASVIIKIMSPMIRHTRLHQCYLMLISHEKRPLASCSSCMRQLLPFICVWAFVIMETLRAAFVKRWTRRN